MELLQLKYFCDAAESQNFSKTARKFLVPPSNISQSIKRLENELGRQLFTRQSNLVVLNDYGKAFYEKIMKALELMDEGVALLSDDGNTGAINICINTNRRIIMNEIEKFKKLYPSVSIRASYFGDPTTEEFHFVIDGADFEQAGFRKILLISEQIALAVNENNPIASKQKIDISDLRDAPFITMNKKTSLYKTTFKICEDFGFEPNIAIQSDDPVFVRKCVQLGLGIAFVPTVSWRNQFPEGIVLKPLKYRREIYAYVNEKNYLPLCAKNFLDMLITDTEKS